VVFSISFWQGWKEIVQRNSVGVFQSVIAFLVISAVISYFRMKKRGEDFAKSVYDLFYGFYRQEREPGK
jgi:hypothetical protein